MIKFGPSGNCVTFYNAGYKKTLQAPKWLYELGLDAYEYSFGKGILLSDETAIAIGDEMKKYGISVSVHAPYFINFASPNNEIVENSYKYVLDSLHKLSLLQGNRLVVHVGSCGKVDRNVAVKLCKERLDILKDKILEAGFQDMYICLETMGKQAQIGSVDEILDFCTLYEKYIPTFDFGHINSITQGSLKGYEDYKAIIDKSILIIGEEKTKICHIHFSKIEYGAKGEIKHLTLEDDKYGPEFCGLAQVISEYNLTPTIISESKEYMARDAKILKNIYENVK
ncbi:MAG: TIM barrel protein [Clostridia bacterium]|nr:TIM barrel protein [Clostridia bacterium]